MKKWWKDLKEGFALIPQALQEKVEKDQLMRDVYVWTGFEGDQAKDLVRLLIRWHYFDQSKDTALRLAKYGIKVGVTTQKDEQP